MYTTGKSHRTGKEIILAVQSSGFVYKNILTSYPENYLKRNWDLRNL